MDNIKDLDFWSNLSYNYILTKAIWLNIFMHDNIYFWSDICARISEAKRYVRIRVVKKLENLKPDPTDDFGPFRRPDPKKP